MKTLSILFVLILWFSTASVVKAQTPKLRDFNFTPDSIDTRTGAKSITFTVTASETDSVTLLVRPTSFSYVGAQNLAPIDNGMFQATVIYPDNSPHQTWEIYAIQLGNSATHLGEFFSTTDLATLGFKTYFQVIGNYIIEPAKSRKRVRFL